jgi:chemotaxis protein MotA
MSDGSKARAKSAAARGGNQPAWKPDLATWGGLAVALAGIIGGLILEKGKLQDIAQATAAMIVLGGTFGAVLVTSPLPVVRRAVGALRDVFFERPARVEPTIDEIIQYSTQARKNGIVSLESDAERAGDPFLRKALGLAVDGTDLQELRHMMELELNQLEHRLESEAKVWESAGGYAPTIGIIGAVMGLIQVMKHLEDIKEVGSGIAVAFVATVYGVGSANLLFLPAASKLRARARDVLMLNEMMLEGVVGIVEGLNPKLIRTKLEAFSEPGSKRVAARRSGEAVSGANGKPGVRGDGVAA